MKISSKIILWQILVMVVWGTSASAQVNVDNIYCMGNGRMAAYGSNADIIQLFGPPYSSPSLLKISLSEKGIEVKNTREKNTAIWQHRLVRRGDTIGCITDFVDAHLPVFVRKIELKEPVSFIMQIDSRTRVVPNTGACRRDDPGLNSALLIESPRGIPFYDDYPMTFKQYMQVAGINTVQISDSDHHTYEIHCSPGTGYIYIIGGPLYPDCVSNTHKALAADYTTLQSRTCQWWKEFSERRENFTALIPDDCPMKDKLLQTIDDVSVALKTQQGREGAIIAGHNYHLGYVRDQYGASRCLLALGYYREAKEILNFYWHVWKREGVIRNAQGVGVNAFHFAENDEVEITSYLIIQAFDYYKKTGDNRFIKKIFPMLEWAWNTSKTKLKKNMEPFNGDETYIAGGIFPRSHIIDGSAEATLLFIVSGKEILKWIADNNYWKRAGIEKESALVNAVRSHYRENFFDDGRLYCNNPRRSVEISLPEFRYGVCEGRFKGCEIFGWTRKNKNNRYLCPVCFAKEKGRSLPKVLPKKFLIHSVSFIPLYIGSDMFTLPEIRAMTDSIVAVFNETGRLPSKRGGHITVGYDYGMLLYNLTKLGDHAAPEIYKKMLSVLDATGTWSEYYVDGKARGTRYRPWESGINLEAAILFAESFDKN